MKNVFENKQWVNCSCHDNHHAITLWYDEEFNALDLSMRVNNYRPFWNRVISALKYVFNFNNKNLYYDSFTIDEENVHLIELMCQNIKRNKIDKAT